MKTVFTLLVSLVLTGTMLAGGPEFQKAMGSALKQMSAANSIDDMKNAANQFERISKVETDQWLPLYYHAHCYIIMSFMEREDKDLKDEFLDVAETSVNKLLEMQPENAEVHTIHGFMYSARLVVNPAVRGMKYGMLSGQAIGKALKLDPANPRAQYMNIQNEMGQAQFFGKDIAPYCAQAKAAWEHFDEYPIVSPIDPSWGKKELKDLSESCK
ncbi:MAG: hypothetical protein KDC12_05755 [Flavobacteriales bacterium]|nr:hypothetical protein [Flavobacteriales bacterium]